MPTMCTFNFICYLDTMFTVSSASWFVLGNCWETFIMDFTVKSTITQEISWILKSWLLTLKHDFSSSKTDLEGLSCHLMAFTRTLTYAIYHRHVCQYWNNILVCQIFFINTLSADTINNVCLLNVSKAGSCEMKFEFCLR